MGWWRCFTGAPDNEEDSSGSRQRAYYYAGDEFGGRGAGNNRGSSDGESTSGESRTSSEMCGAEGTDVGTQFRRRERLHRKMQSELCEISPKMRATIGERRISILRRQFSWHDSDNNGYIESHELEDFLRAAGFNPVQPSLELWCSHLDADNEGCLTFPDYVQFWQENKKELENDEFLIKMAFAFFDKDGDGTIDKEELVECLQELGDPLTKDEIDRFFKHVLDSDDSEGLTRDKITYEELLDFFREDRKSTWLLDSHFDEPAPNTEDLRVTRAASTNNGTLTQIRLKQQQLRNGRSSKFEKQQFLKRMRSMQNSRSSLSPLATPKLTTQGSSQMDSKSPRRGIHSVSRREKTPSFPHSATL